QAMFAKERGQQQGRESNREQSAEQPSGDTPNRSRFGGTQPLKYYETLRAPDKRDPRGYVIPSDQPDFLTATKFLNALIKTGVSIHRATGEFKAGGKSYPAGSYVVKAAQAFRPHVMDMFEPQDHPNDFAYPGGPPIPPYDNAGWTLAYQMGVKFDRILDGFDGPFEKINGLIMPPAGKGTTAPAPLRYLPTHQAHTPSTHPN